MKQRLVLMACCIVTSILLTGCLGGSGSSSGSIFGGSGVDVAGLTGGTGAGSGDFLGHVPEPATIVLLGAGLAAFAFLRRKRKK